MKKIHAITNWIFEKLIPIQIWIAYSKKTNWVSYHAKKRIRKSQSKDKRSLAQKASEKWFEWMHPQRWRTSLGLAFSLILIPQLILGAIPLQSVAFIDADFLATVWQVLASIIGISFVIVVFLTEYSQDQTYERRSFPIYISATSMIFTVMVGLLTLMSMGINLIILKSSLKNDDWVIGVSLWNSVLFFLNLILTIILYIRTYQLLRPSYFRKILVVYHRKKVLDRVYQELFKRVKQNLSIQYLQDLGIETTTFRDNNTSKSKVKITKVFMEPQAVDDINFRLVKIASKNAQKIVGDLKKDQIIFWGLPGNNISNEYPEIASINHELNNKLVTEFLSNAIKTKPWKSSKLESASDDLLINRDLISAAIASGQADNVETSLDLYIETIEAFLDSLKQLGYRFTPELADTQDGWFNRWDIFETVYQQYVSLLREALKSNNSEIINEFVGFPSHVMTKAFQFQDHFAFRQFADLYPLIYLFSRQYVSDNRAADQIADRCGLLLAEFANYQIEHQLTQKNFHEEDAKEFFAYAEHILNVFSQLAKYQIDNLDAPHYRRSIGSIRRLLDGFMGKHDEFRISQLEFQTEHITNELLKAEAIRDLQNEKALNSLVVKLQNTRKGSLFGLGTWICHLVDTGKISGNNVDNFLQPIGQEFGNLNLLNQSYNNAISMEDRNRFRWNSWEMDEWAEEAYGESRFGSINFSSWLSIYYTYRALELTPENPETILEITPTSNIKGNLDSIKSNIKYFLEKNNWEYTVKKLGNIELRGQILEKSHETAYAKQLEIEEIETTQIPISDNKIKEFVKDTENTWQEQGTLRNLFTVYGRYSPRTSLVPPKELLPFGIHQRIPKGVFIEHPKIGYPMWGESYGRSMAQGENLKMCAGLYQLPTMSADLEEFDDVISKQVSLLVTKGLHPIILYGHELYRQFFDSKKYEPHWRTTKTGPKGLRNIDGFYEEIVVLRIATNPNSVVIYDPSEFGDLVQYKVDEVKSDFPLSFSVKEISEERAREYLIQHPDLSRHPETGEDLSEEKALRRIQQDVELAIWQRFDIENINLESGVVINFGSN